MQNTLNTNNNGISTAEIENAGMDQVAQGSSQVGIGVIMSMAALVGVWGVACLIGGIAKSGSLFEMVRGYFTAVLGM